MTSYLATVWATGLAVSLVWAFVDWCTGATPEVLYDAARVKPVALYLLLVLFLVFWPASIAVIAEQAWNLKKDRDKK